MRSQVYGGGSHLSPNSDYIVPFTFWIPSGLPGSTEEKYGFVRYSAKATLEVGSGFLQQQNATSIRHFSVTGIVDLNHFNVVSQPAEDEDESNLCCLWCASGPIVTRVKLDRTGFVPGEAIRCVVSVDNRSGNPFNGAKVCTVKSRIKVQWIPLKKITLGQPKVDWSSYPIGNLYTQTAFQIAI